MSEGLKKQARKPISGVSLASFLQLLEQERKSCTLVVTQGDQEGQFYFHEGAMIDAEYNGIVGLKAAYAILNWEDPHFNIAREEERIQRISHTLTHILITATTKNDEEKENRTTEERTMAQGVARATGHGNPALAGLIENLIEIPGVKHYYLLNRQGRMITQSSRNQEIGDFIAYSIVSGIQMREVLEAKGLHHVRIKLGDGGMLLIVPGAGMIIGLLLDERASISEVFPQLRRAVAKK